MIKILFIRTNKANLPEIDAYIEYFNKTEEFKAYDSANYSEKIDYDAFDILWEFKGINGVRRNDNQLLVHEYASLSTGSYPKLKNRLKVLVNKKPDLRIYLNENVKKGYNFTDNIPHAYRDMGIDKSFFNVREPNKEYDFVYVGAISRERKIEELLEMFTKKGTGKICLVGEPEKEIYQKFKSNKNIIFTGKVPYKEVPLIASKAEYGINYIPDSYPFNIQTSTKLLEYLALGLKVVTTDYYWARQFEEKHNCSFYYLNHEIDLKEIDSFEYKTSINVEDFLWDNIIEASNIKKQLLSHF